MSTRVEASARAEGGANAERLVFAPSVEGLLIKGLSLTDSLRAELRAMGIDLDRPLMPAYPAELWHRALHLVAKRVYPDLGLPEAYLRMGERTVYGLEATLLGKAMVAMAKLVGPRRMMMRLPNSVKSGSNFAHLEAVELAPNSFQLTSQPYMGYGEFMQGSVSAALGMTGAVNVRVEILGYDRPSEKLVMRASWQA